MSKRLSKNIYEPELLRLQRELVKLQSHVRNQGLKVCVIFEGRDAAGKGGAIKRILQRTNPRTVRVVALAQPTERERSQWYFQRYVAHLPAAGEIVLFDRSWYNRAGVEKVMGFCTDEEYDEFLVSCPDFERMLIRSGIILIKFWFSVSDVEQERRFMDRIEHPIKRWKLSEMDLESRARWIDYSRAKDAMFAHTDTNGSVHYLYHLSISPTQPSQLDHRAIVSSLHASSNACILSLTPGRAVLSSSAIQVSNASATSTARALSSSWC